MTAGLLIIGFGLLVMGAELLVRGASRMAAAFGISPLVIGLTIVAFGTSSPELAVSIQSASAGNADIAVGNVVGSNIFNVLFILGLSALITPLTVSAQLVRLDVPLMIAASLALLLLGLDYRIGRIEGILLAASLAIYIGYLICRSKKEESSRNRPASGEMVRKDRIPDGRRVLDVLFVAVGLGLLYFGSKWFVQGAVSVARLLGISELIVGLTIIAGGTSLPEVVTSVVASIRGERDIAVGNVVGSNLFNILCVLGISAAVSPAGVALSPPALRIDIPIMIAVAIACLPIFFTGNCIARWEGALFFGYYIAYTAYLVLSAARNPMSPVFNAAMLYFVIPLTTVTLLVLFVRAARAKRRS